jgi:hypothetical protein
LAVWRPALNLFDCSQFGEELGRLRYECFVWTSLFNLFRLNAALPRIYFFPPGAAPFANANPAKDFSPENVQFITIRCDRTGVWAPLFQIPAWDAGQPKESKRIHKAFRSRRGRFWVGYIMNTGSKELQHDPDKVLAHHGSRMRKKIQNLWHSKRSKALHTRTTWLCNFVTRFKKLYSCPFGHIEGFHDGLSRQLAPANLLERKGLEQMKLTPKSAESLQQIWQGRSAQNHLVS